MIYKRKFNSIKNYHSFCNRLHKNRIARTYNYDDNGKVIYVVKYYRDTKKLRERHNFPPAEF